VRGSQATGCGRICEPERMEVRGSQATGCGRICEPERSGGAKRHGGCEVGLRQDAGSQLGTTKPPRNEMERWL
jgi:hypothetical protein